MERSANIVDLYGSLCDVTIEEPADKPLPPIEPLLTGLENAKEDSKALQGWYEELDDAAAYSRRCRVYVPEGLAGKRVLDVNCRNGKGAYKLAEAVSPEGFVLGTCVREEQVAAARAGMAKALGRAGLAAPNMAFEQAFPEDLGAVAADGSFDVVYMNGSINVAYNPMATIIEAYRVLAPGGRLVLATVCADGARSNKVRMAARKLGNVVQSAVWLDSFLMKLEMLGFADVRVLFREPVDATAGVEANTVVPTVPTDETVTFSDVIIEAVKPAGTLGTEGNVPLFQGSGTLPSVPNVPHCPGGSRGKTG